jgi:hypothetical protein
VQEEGDTPPFVLLGREDLLGDLAARGVVTH